MAAAGQAPGLPERAGPATGSAAPSRRGGGHRCGVSRLRDRWRCLMAGGRSSGRAGKAEVKW
jgi:hypothetical protein